MKRTLSEFTVSLARVVAVALTVVLFLLPAAPLARAADWNSPLQVSAAGHSSVANGLTSITQIKVFSNPIFYHIAQAAIQSMVRSTVTWINSGFQGSPAYATDLKATLQDAADQEAERYLTTLLDSSAINSPFRDPVAREVLAAYYVATSRDGFTIQNPYTLNQVSPNDAAFQRGDFSQGGFPAWLSETINPSNNWFGAEQLQKAALDSRIGQTVGQINSELAQGNGFFSYRKCDKQVTTLEGSGTTVQTINGAQVDLTPRQTCLNSRIETPGSVIANSLNKSLGLGADSLVQAKEFDEIVNALMGQLLQNVIGSNGLGGVSRSSTATAGRAYFDQTTTSSSATTSASVSLVTSFLQVVSTQSTQLQTYLTSWQTINSAAQAAKTALQQSTCLPNASALITTQVDPVIIQASTVSGSIPPLLAQLDTINTNALDASTQTSTERSTTLSTASTDYQTVTSSTNFPSASDFTFAAQQSQDSGTTSPPSLLTQMNQLTAQARCGQ